MIRNHHQLVDEQAIAVVSAGFQLIEVGLEYVGLGKFEFDLKCVETHFRSLDSLKMLLMVREHQQLDDEQVADVEKAEIICLDEVELGQI